MAHGPEDPQLTADPPNKHRKQKDQYIMKLNFNTLVKWSAAIFGGAVLAACADLSDLENRVDDLESRVSALEAQIPALNESVLAINALFESYGNDASVIVNLQQVTENNETYYTFQLSGDETGTVYTLKQGQPGSAPEIDVRYNEETGKYEWWANYAGEGEEDDWQQIKVNGTEDPATTDAVVPQFRVNEKKNWEVSTDNGQKWTPVYYTGTQDPVPAVGSDSQWFEDISYNPESNILSITMGETVYEILALSDFSCFITDADGEKVEYNFPVVFAAGETRNYTVAMTGVETARVIAPSGWTAELGDPDAAGKANFSVTAPGAAAGTSASAAASAPQTKVSANSKTDITIHAINAKGLSIFAKMQVKAVAGDNPAMTVAAATSDQGYSRVKFDVSGLSKVSSYRCLLYAADEPAPTESMLASGQLVSEDLTDQLAFDNTADGASIEYGGEYTLYVLPYNSDGESGSIITAEATTRIPATYSEVYNAGESITIAGKKFSSTEYGTPGQINSTSNTITEVFTSNNGKPKIFFVSADANAVFGCSGAVKDLIIIGDSFGTRSKMTFSQYIRLNQGSDGYLGQLIICNMDIDSSEFGNYVITQNADNAFEFVAFENCHITTQAQRPFVNITSQNRSIRNFIMQDCIYEFTPHTSQNYIFALQSSTGNCEATFENIIFENNIFYANSGATSNFKIFNGSYASIANLKLSHNTFINTLTNTSFAIYAKSINTVDITNNIVWTNQAMKNDCGLLRATSTWPTGTVVTENVSYKGNTDTHVWQVCFGGNKNLFNGAEDFIKADSDPFSGGKFNIEEEIFIPNNTYTAYGSSIGR